MSGAFDCTKQSHFWLIVRNVVLDAVKHLVAASTYLGEMLRYKLKENADIVFEYTLLQEFGSTNLNNNAIIKLLQPLLRSTTLRDYNADVDCVVNEFIAVAQVVPRTLDNTCTGSEETINIRKLIYKLLNPANRNRPRRVRSYVPPPPG
eukprot:464982_1